MIEREVALWVADDAADVTENHRAKPRRAKRIVVSAFSRVGTRLANG